MTIAIIGIFVVYTIISIFTIWQMRRNYEQELQWMRTQNKDLLDRLLTKNQLPPSGVNLTQVYEERKQEQRANPKKRIDGPIERLTDKWTEKDRVQADKSGRVM